MRCRRRHWVILLGDKDQLASVEAGAVLGDICFGAVPVARPSVRDEDGGAGEAIRWRIQVRRPAACSASASCICS
jgi:hypothetical protein